jgi:cytochrome d ubiquinol oxidase subunit I
MNAPAGFDLVDGRPVNIDVVAAMLNPASGQQVLHMVLAAYVAIGFGVASVHAFFLLRDRTSMFHRRALGIALSIGAISVPLQILSGDALAKLTARIQPVKFAAMEAHYETATNAPILLGGIADDEAMDTRYGIEIPSLLSILAHGDPDAEVIGLDAFPRDEWPNVQIVHWAFDVMVACGFTLLGISLWAFGAWLRNDRHLPDRPTFLRALVFTGPLGFIAIEAGWVVTEVGRQPWIIYGILRTEDAVTPVPGLVVPFVTFTLLYILLAVIVVALMKRQFLERERP